MAGASLFSGRPDPTWPIAAETVETLIHLWNAMPRSPMAAPRAEALGYRGAFVRGPHGEELRAFAGTVEGHLNHGREVRSDPSRQFERKLLQSAPKGVIPDSVLQPK